MKEQINLFDEPQKISYKTVHGGTRTRGKRKDKRPLSTKYEIHLVLKSKKAIGQKSFFMHAKEVESIITTYARKCGVMIKESVNMGNHLHLRAKIMDRKLFASFLKTVTALIARKITGARKGKSFGRFWDGLAFLVYLRLRSKYFS